MNGVFEDLVAASMSVVRLPIPGLEFQRGLEGRKFLVALLPRSAPEEARRRGRRHVQPARARAERERRALRRLGRRRPHDLRDDGRARHHDQRAHLDDLRTGAASGMAGARARGGVRARQARARLRRSRSRPRSRPGDEGDAAPLSAAAGDPAAGGGRVRLRGPSHPGRHDGGGVADPHPSHARVVPGAACSSIPSVSHPSAPRIERHTHRVDPVRRRPAPLHRSALRGDRR